MIESTDIIERIKNREDINILINHVIVHTEDISTLVNIMATEKKAIKYDCEKIVRLVSEQRPDLVYPFFDNFIKLLIIDNKFLKWGAITTLSNLARIDKKNKFEKFFDTYFSLIQSTEMVTAANVIGNAWKIAKAKPQLSDKIVDAIFKLQETNYLMKGEVSPECKKIVSGDAILTFEKIFEQCNKKEEIIKFVNEQRKNSRTKVKKNAERIYKKLAHQD